MTIKEAVHRINNLLISVISGSEIIKEDPDNSKKTKKIAEYVNNSGKEISEIIGRLENGNNKSKTGD